MTPTTQEFGPCPCQSEATGIQCVLEGTKLTRYGHLVGCTCRSCLGRRNKRKGAKANARGHKRLGGQGGTVNDDLYYSYSINLSVEVKTGAQIPRTFLTFISGAWIHDAMGQATKKLPVGADAFPAVLIEQSPSKAYLVVDVGGRSLRDGK